MHQTIIEKVNGRDVIDTNGNVLRVAGNENISPGKPVWTDGKLVYGNRRVGGGSSYAPQSGYLWMNKEGIWKIDRGFQKKLVLELDFDAMMEKGFLPHALIMTDDYAYFAISDKYGYQLGIWDLMTGKQVEGVLDWQQEYVLNYEDFIIDSKSKDLLHVCRYYAFNYHTFQKDYHYPIYRNGKLEREDVYSGNIRPIDRPYIHENATIWCEHNLQTSISEDCEEWHLTGYESKYFNQYDDVHYISSSVSGGRTWTDKVVYHPESRDVGLAPVFFYNDEALSSFIVDDENNGALGKYTATVTEGYLPKLLPEYEASMKKYVWYEIVGDIRDKKNPETYSGWEYKYVTYRDTLGPYKRVRKYRVDVNLQRWTYDQASGAVSSGSKYNYRDVHYYLYYVPVKFDLGRSWKTGSLSHHLDLGNYVINKYVNDADDSEGSISEAIATVDKIPQLEPFKWCDCQIMSIYDVDADKDGKSSEHLINQIQYDNSGYNIKKQWQLAHLQQKGEVEVVIEAEARYNYHCGWFSSVAPVIAGIRNVLVSMDNIKGEK